MSSPLPTSLLLPLPQPRLSLAASDASGTSVLPELMVTVLRGCLPSLNLVFVMIDRWNVLTVWVETQERADEMLCLFHLLIFLKKCFKWILWLGKKARDWQPLEDSA